MQRVVQGYVASSDACIDTIVIDTQIIEILFRKTLRDEMEDFDGPRRRQLCFGFVLTRANRSAEGSGVYQFTGSSVRPIVSLCQHAAYYVPG